MHEHQLAVWIRAVKGLHLGPLFKFFRRDTLHISSTERIDTVDALGLYSTQRRLKRKRYDIDKVLRHSLFTIEDVAFNSIFIRANQHLRDIASFIKEELPEELTTHIPKTEAALDQLWDPYSGQYYARDFVTHKLLKESTVATLLPLYSGCITAERAKQLVRLLENQHVFGTDFPLPSTPPSSPLFNPVRYWQGPSWVNINWLITDGLERYGFHDHAQALRESTIAMVEQGGFYEYFNPLSGEPVGVADFSWTAALYIDLVKN